MFKNITAIIGKILTKTQKEEYLQFLEIQKRWKKNIAKKIQKNATITDYSQKAITIKTKNPSWRNELVFFKNEIKKNFQRTNAKLIKL